jgi:hypothetical protein
MNWSNLSNVSTLNVSFNQLTLNLNGFFTTYVQPILADIAQYTQPIISVYDVLNSTVPGLSSLPGPMNGFTVLDALEAAGLVTQTEAAELNAIGNFATEVQNLINDTAGVGTGGVITFGNYTFEGSALVGLPDVTTFLPGLINDIPLGPLSSLPIGNLSQYLDPTSSSNLQNIENNPAAWLQQYAQNHASQLGSALTVTDAIGNGGLIQFPVMDDPASLLGMLFGANVPLITVNTGTLDLPIDLNLNFNIPVYGLFSIGAGFDFNGSFTAEIEAGYDTQGLHDYFAGGGTNSNDLLDGFYVQGQNGADPGTNVTCNITATASFGASISVIIASASIDLTGGITADVSVGTNPTLYATGNKIYVYSSGSMRNLDDVYSLSGQISTSLDLTAKLQFLFWSQTWTIASLDPVLWDSSEFTGTGAQQPPPVIYAFSASQGPMTGGDTMTVYGMNLEGASQVIPVIDTGPYTGPGPGGGGNIDLPAVTPFNVTSTSFQITIPPSGYIYSDLLIEVLTPGGETDSINQPGQQYEYIPDPTVTKIVTLAAGGFSGPASGGAGGGTLVEIEGTGLGYVTGVNFGNVAGAIFNPPPSSPYYDYGLYAPQPGGIFVYAPAGTGTVNVTLASPGGTAVDPNAFTFVPQPQVAGVSPALGPLDVSGSAAESVTIFGQNFGYLDGNGNPVATASGVLFGYTPPASAQNIAPLATLPVLSDTYHPGIYIQGYVSIPAYWAITVKVPYSSAAGPVDVLVETTPTGFPEPIVDPTQQGVGNWSSPTSQASPASSADVFTYLAQPAITSVTPVGGPTGGGTTVTIGGTALSYGKFHGQCKRNDYGCQSGGLGRHGRRVRDHARRNVGAPGRCLRRSGRLHVRDSACFLCHESRSVLGRLGALVRRHPDHHHRQVSLLGHGSQIRQRGGDQSHHQRGRHSTHGGQPRGVRRHRGRKTGVARRDGRQPGYGRAILLRRRAGGDRCYAGDR